MYIILDKELKNKNEITNECRSIVEKNIDKELSGYDYDFIIEVLKNHPNWETKSKNMISLKVQKDFYDKNYCFFIYYKNGTCDDVSYHYAIRNIKVDTDRKIDLIMPFGKYKGISIYEINDKKYLEWTLTIPNLTRDLKVKIGQYIRYGYIPFNPVALTKSIQKNKINT